MFKKSLTLLAVIGVFTAVKTAPADAQIAPVEIVVAQISDLVCLGADETRAALNADSRIHILNVLQTLGISSDRLGDHTLCRYEGRLVWRVWINTGGNRDLWIVDALDGVRLQLQ